MQPKLAPLPLLELEAVLERSVRVAWMREHAEARMLAGSRADAFAYARLTVELGNLRALINLEANHAGD